MAWRLRGSLTVVVCALLLAAPSASALSAVSAPGADRGDGVWVGKAQCPQGKRVISGGFSVAPGAEALVNKAKGKRSWLVKAEDTSALTVHAYCSRNLRVTKESASGKFDEFDRRAKVAARCPRGRVAVAGGWEYSQLIDNQPVFRSLGTGGRRWSVHAFGDGPIGEDGEEITAFAYCLRSGDVKVRTKESSIPAETTVSRNVRCKRGEQLLGGGFDTRPKSDFFNDLGPDLFYFVSKRAGNRAWRVSAHNFSSAAGTIRVRALCLT